MARLSDHKPNSVERDIMNASRVRLACAIVPAVSQPLIEVEIQNLSSLRRRRHFASNPAAPLWLCSPESEITRLAEERRGFWQPGAEGEWSK